MSVDLVAGFIDESAFNGTLDSVVREGTTVVVPWFASAAIAAANNSTNVFRISNISSADARVFVEVLTLRTAPSPIRASWKPVRRSPRTAKWS